MLDQLRQTPRAPGYAAGNLLNLVLALGGDVRGFDCSRLCVWQAYLRGVEAPDVNFTHADLAGSVFTDTFASITSVAFTPDGERLIASCADGTVRVWRVADGQPLNVFFGHSGIVWSVAVSPDGQWCANSGDDQTVRVWHIATGQVLHVLRDHTHIVLTVTFSQDGTLLASGSQDETLQIWEVTSGKHLRTLGGGHGAVYALAFAPSCTGQPFLASAGGGKPYIYVWDVSDRRLVRRPAGFERMIRCLAWSPDGSILLSSGHDPALRLWDTVTWQLRGMLSGHTDVVPTVAFSADGAMIVSGSSDSTVRLWDVRSGQQISSTWTNQTSSSVLSRRRERFSRPASRHPAFSAISASTDQRSNAVSSAVLTRSSSSERRCTAW